MSRRLSRRKVLKSLVFAGAGVLPARILSAHAFFQDSKLELAGRAVKLTITAISAHTIRINLSPIEAERDAFPAANDSLIQLDWTGQQRQFKQPESNSFRLLNFVIKVGADPLRLDVFDRQRLVQQIAFDRKTAGLSFRIGNSPILGFGEGGPQFDRRGITDQMRSGQGGYRLRTHGGRVPIPWLIRKDGWALYIHPPEGTFDLSGEKGFFIPKPTKQLPLDIFLVSSLDPATVIGEFSRLTGLPEMPPLWSLGYLQSHRTLHGPDEILWVAKTFREKKL